MPKQKCAGVRLSGKRGCPCGSAGKYELRGKSYCGNHLAVAQREPAEFKSAMESWVRREAKAEIKRRMAAAQVDMFPDGQLQVTTAAWVSNVSDVMSCGCVGGHEPDCSQNPIMIDAEEKAKTCPYAGCPSPFAMRPPCALCYE